MSAVCKQVDYEKLFDIPKISKLITLREDKVQRFLFKKRKYKLASEGFYNIITGSTSKGDSVLCLASKNTICLFFDKHGNYLSSDIHKRTLSDKSEIDQFLIETYGFTDKPIVFKQFSFEFDGKRVEILPFNSWIIEFFENASTSNEEERKQNVKRVREWIFGNCFVFNCWNDYWVNGNGEITDS